MRQNKIIHRKRYVSGGTVHEILKWQNGKLTPMTPRKVGGAMRLLPIAELSGIVKKVKDIVTHPVQYVKKALQAEPFSQPSGYNRNSVLTAINSSMGNGLNRPQKMIRRLM